MNIDCLFKDLNMMQISDSFFPTGLYANSNGLEYVFANNKNFSFDHLIDFISVSIKQLIGPCDCIVLSNAFNYAKTSRYTHVKDMDSICVSMKTIKETRETSIRSGIQLIKCVRGFLCNDKILNQYYDDIDKNIVSGVYPVSFALCCNALGIKKEQSLLMFLHGFVISIVGAALRLGMIDHFESQKIIHYLKPLLVDIARKYSGKSIIDIWQFSPQLDINQMNHEQMNSKMFIT